MRTSLLLYILLPLLPATAVAQRHEPRVSVGATVSLGLDEHGIPGEGDIYVVAPRLALRPGLEVRGYATSFIARGTLVGPRVEHCFRPGCLYGGVTFGPMHSADPTLNESGLAGQIATGFEVPSRDLRFLRWKAEYAHTFVTGTLPRRDNDAGLLGVVLRFP